MLTSRVLPPILQLHATPQLITSTSRRDEIAQEPRMSTDGHWKNSEKGEKRATSPCRPSKTMLTRSVSSASPARQSKGTPSLSSQTSPARITRKRAASLLDTADSKARAEEHSPPSSRESNGVPSVGPGEFAEHVCLCQPEPKIPRPRNGEPLFNFLCPLATDCNGDTFVHYYRQRHVFICNTHRPYYVATDSFFVAFILYRQHHQQIVMGRYPGLANPEISKIIGEQWQSESDAVKSEWKALADVSCFDAEWRTWLMFCRKKKAGTSNNTPNTDTSLVETASPVLSQRTLLGSTPL